MRVVVVSTRLHERGSVGGAETLLWSLARDARALGHEVEFLTTCALDHRSWRNELPSGRFEREGVSVVRFPVDPRDEGRLARLQIDLSQGRVLPRQEQLEWIANTANSAPLLAYLRENAARVDRVIVGPYLFGLTWNVCRALPDKTLLVSCFHDEPYARVEALTEAFRGIRGFLFNTDPERRLAHRLMPGLSPRVEAVVAMGIEPFEVDKSAFARRTGIAAPFVIYSGRREDGKGTPVLVDFMSCFRRRTGRDVHLVMTGSGAVDVPPDLAPAFHDLGFVSEQEKREAMAGAAAFVHPSINESLSIVVLEAWLARTPALVHARGEVLRWQCQSASAGLWFRDYPEFEEALLRLLDDAPLSAKFGEQGRRYVLQRYAPEAVRARLASALEA